MTRRFERDFFAHRGLPSRGRSIPFEGARHGAYRTRRVLSVCGFTSCHDCLQTRAFHATSADCNSWVRGQPTSRGLAEFRFCVFIRSRASPLLAQRLLRGWERAATGMCGLCLSDPDCDFAGPSIWVSGRLSVDGGHVTRELQRPACSAASNSTLQSRGCRPCRYVHLCAKLVRGRTPGFLG